MAELNDFNGRELALKHARLRAEIETLPLGTKATMDMAREAQRLQAELYERLYRYMKSNVLPIKLPAPTKKDLEFIDHQKITREQIEGAVAPKISFNFEVFSSLNTRVDRFKIDAPTKKEAMAKAELRAKKYPGRVKVKIS